MLSYVLKRFLSLLPTLLIVSLVVFLVVPGIAALITAVWFGIGSTVDLFRMFRDLKNRVANPLDNGMVEGHVAISEKAKLDQIDREQQKK